MKLCLMFCVAAMTSVCAHTIQVHVGCSNGKNVCELPITVLDNTGMNVLITSPTDGDGNFLIENSQDYMAPFFMEFQAITGSECGPYPIQIGDDGQVGTVVLQYDPIDSPCSCSWMTE